MSGFYIGVDGKARKVKGGCIGVGGVARKIKKVYIGDENGVARKVYDSGKKLSEYTVGDTVYLMENGNPVEYLIVHQGTPNKADAKMYSDSCDGVWLLRKNILEKRVWDSTNNNYTDSDIHAYLSESFLNRFDSSLRSTIKQVNIPCTSAAGGSSINYFENGLSAKVFLLGGYEIGWTKQSNGEYIPYDGLCLDYFNGVSSDKRIAYMDGTPTSWWTRSATTLNGMNVYAVSTNGGNTNDYSYNKHGVRPALILPFDAEADSGTNIIN